MSAGRHYAPRTRGDHTPADGPARALWRSYVRHARIAHEHDLAAARDLDDLAGFAVELEDRLGVDLLGIDHDDGWLYDVLACFRVDMTTTEANIPRSDRPWRWEGQRNNHGSPVIRKPRGIGNGEISAVRYVAIKLGVIRPDYAGQLYRPVTDPLDVNPWHQHTQRRNDG